MIDLYTAATPNGQKASIMLEECGLEYSVHALNLGAGEQHSAHYLQLNPNGKIPTIVDNDVQGDAITVFESGAILTYLAEKPGRFLPTEARARAAVLSWLNWQMGALGPMLGQAWHFGKTAPEKVDYAIKRYVTESVRLLSVMDQQLNRTEFLAGDEVSIADFACYGWTRSGLGAVQEIGGAMPTLPHVSRWLNAVGGRDGVQKGMAVPKQD